MEVVVNENCLENSPFLCTFKKKYVGGCKGDSGSGLVYKNTLVGIFIKIYGILCVDEFPGKFVSISYVYEWIQKTIAN